MLRALNWKAAPGNIIWGKILKKGKEMKNEKKIRKKQKLYYNECALEKLIL